MQNDAATLYCSNDFCQAPNRLSDNFCQICGTALIRRYLWAVEIANCHVKVQNRQQLIGALANCRVGDLINERYRLEAERIVLDTKPGLSPETRSVELIDVLKPYLKLISYRTHVPQVYDLVSIAGTSGSILLLELAPISAVQLMPELANAWKQATPMRQLHWLWQMAQLWDPFSSEGVASSLLNSQLLRVQSSLLRLLQLQPDQDSPPQLARLGQFWSQLATFARPGITQFLEQLCFDLSQGKVNKAEQIVAVLDQGIAEVGRSLPPNTLIVANRTDQGPSRQRNEDACYPPSGTKITAPDHTALAIVCDGIGGHEGGNVASNLAIETIQQQVQKLIHNYPHLDPITLSNELENSTRAANDQISQRNDDEHRHGRQRMGTTLVAALARAHEMYIAHVGDSRAYLITSTGCHQVTLDDDVASREVRLGYALYRDALQQASSSSLVQALGMSSSEFLHPTVQRFILDEDCVFLLCSDGLSDYDRVEQYWETEILPIVTGEVDVSTAGARLIEIANTQNGHDNVTVSLIYCRVNSSNLESTVSVSLAQQIDKPDADCFTVSATVAANKQQSVDVASSSRKTQLLQFSSTPRRSFVLVLLSVVLLFGLGSGALLAYLWKQKSLPIVNNSSGSSVAPTTITTSPQLELPTNKNPDVPQGTLLRIKNIPASNGTQQPVPLLLEQRSEQANSVIGFIPTGAMVRVRAIVESVPKERDDWLWLEVCSIHGQTKLESIATSPAAANASPALKYQPVKLSQKGWIRVTQIKRFSENVQLNKCSTPVESTAPPTSQK